MNRKWGETHISKAQMEAIDIDLADGGAEWALWWLALNHPDIISEAFGNRSLKILVGNREALATARRLIRKTLKEDS